MQQYYSKAKDAKVCFESQVLEHVILSLGINRHYFMETRMLHKKPSQTLQYYILDQHIEEGFFKTKDKQE